MGKAMSILRPVKNIGIQARAEKVISMEKPKPAPWHPKTEDRLHELRQVYPELKKDLNEKDEELLAKLKDIYVTSHDHSPILRKENPNRPLPKLREYQEPSEMGFPEPSYIPKGKLSMRQALVMIGKHHKNPEANNAAALAQEYILELKTADNILKHFRTFEYHQPPKAKQTKNGFKIQTLGLKSSNQTCQLEDSNKDR